MTNKTWTNKELINYMDSKYAVTVEELSELSNLSVIEVKRILVEEQETKELKELNASDFLGGFSWAKF